MQSAYPTMKNDIKTPKRMLRMKVFDSLLTNFVGLGTVITPMARAHLHQLPLHQTKVKQQVLG